MSLPPPPCADAGAVLDVYRRDPGVHPYGIADAAQFWDVSTWWWRGDAVAGCMDLPGSPVPVVYAVAAGAEADAATLDLLGDLAAGAALPARFVIHGPRGLTERLEPGYRPRWRNDYLKMHLARPQRLPPADPAVRVLGRGDLADLEALYATDPHAGDFFHAGLLDTGHYVGLDLDGALVASAGVHVVDREHGVAAIANVATRPDQRRRGLARRVVATHARRLLAEVPTVGLNVREANVGARTLYERLGFDVVAAYLEADLERVP